MSKRLNVAAIVAICVCSLVAGRNVASAQMDYSSAKVIKAQSRADTCRDDCVDGIQCIDFCAKTCQGGCAKRFTSALKACLRGCGRPKH
jgi:hypothetical protein